MTNYVNNSPFIRTTREYPEDLNLLCVEVDRAYVDTADAVNNRTIGIFPTSKPAINGESWFVNKNQKQNGIRKVYTFSTFGPIPHGLDNIWSGIYAFTRIYGTFTDGTIWYPLPYVDVVAANNQVSLTVDSVNINVTAGAGAPPAITKGYVVLEWISNP